MLKRHSGDRFDELLQETMDCTSRNMHTESLIAIAKHFGEVEYSGDSFQYSAEFQDIARLLQDIENEHYVRGHLGEDMRYRRTTLYRRLLELVGQLVTSDELNALQRTL